MFSFNYYWTVQVNHELSTVNFYHITGRIIKIIHLVRKPHFVSINLFSGLPEKATEYTQNELLGKGQWNAPVLPMQAGYTLGPYKHNG